jgi:dipeptidyl-peptidase-4
MRSSFLILFLLLSTLPVIGQKKELSNQLIWASREFSPEYVYSVSSMNDGEHFSALEENKIVKYSYKNFSKPVATILDGNELTGISIDDYFFNSDETKVLIATKVTSIYRRSFTAEYYVVDLKTKKSTQLFDKGAQMLADFSPDGSKVAFVLRIIFISEILRIIV